MSPVELGIAIVALGMFVGLVLCICTESNTSSLADYDFKKEDR